MSVIDLDKRNLLRWEVKPIWKIRYPSGKSGAEQEGEFVIFGVDRVNLDISRNWEKINSVEQFNQGFAAQPTDFTITIAVKERGSEFEKLRHLSMTATYFDIECDVLKKNESGTITYGDNQHGFGSATQEDYVQWLDGFEKYVGCLVNREGQTVEIGGIPIREFEIVFLERQIKTSANFNADEIIKEGNGVFPTLEDINL